MIAASTFVWHRLTHIEQEGGGTLAILIFLHGLIGKTATAGLFAGAGLAGFGVAGWKGWKQRKR